MSKAAPVALQHQLSACAILNGLLSPCTQTGAWDPEEDDLLYYWQVIIRCSAGTQQQQALGQRQSVGRAGSRLALLHAARCTTG